MGKTLALTIRSIREDTRLLRTHLFRMFLLLVILWFLWLTQWNELGVGAPGLSFFQSVTYLNFAFITLAGIGYFASAITEEKEEMTLGLLRMAGIGPLALLLGKLVPRLTGAVLLLSAQFPFTLLAITLGGVSLGQVQAAYCTLLSYTLLLAGVSLFWSVACRLTKTASLLTSLTIVLLVLVPWFGIWVMPLSAPTSAAGRTTLWLLSRLYAASPLSRINDIMTTGFSDAALGLQVWSNSAAGMLFVLLSWLTFNWFNRDERASSPGRGLNLRVSSRLRRLCGSRVWSNALLWKDMNFLAGGPLMLLAKLLTYGLLGAGLYFLLPLMSWNGQFTWEDYGAWTMSLALIVFLVEGALLASSIFQQEVKWKTLTGLWMLPVPFVLVAYSKVAGCLCGLIPAFLWFAAGAICAPDLLADALSDLLGEPGFWLLAMLYVLLLHLTTFLSLFIKWLALPLAIGILILTNVCCLSAMEEVFLRGGSDVPLAMMLTTSGLATIVLHVSIGERLRALAGQ